MDFFDTNTRGRVRHDLAVFLLCTAPTLGGLAHAQTPDTAQVPKASGVPESAPPTAPPTAPQAAPQAKFSVQIDAPPAVHAVLNRHLALHSFRHLPDLSRTELRRLVADVPDNVRSLLGAMGHFTPDIQVRLDDSAQPLPVVEVRVTPGPQAQVSQVEIDFASPDTPATNGDPSALRDRLRQSWTLPAGLAFTQAAWDAAKSATLSTLTRDTYPAASLTRTWAEVDPDTHTVALRVEIDTGPAFRFGPTQVQGLQRYEAEWVAHVVRQAGAAQGQPYQLAALQTAQQTLAQTGYFESVFVYVDPAILPTPESPESPVQVQVREATRGKLIFGAGVSSDSGPRLSAEHTWQRIPGVDWKAVSRLRLDTDTQLLTTNLTSPPRANGWRWLLGGTLQRQNDDSTHTTSQQLRWGQAQTSERLDRSWVLQYDRARTTGPDTDDTSSALGLYYQWAKRAYQPMPFPDQGWGLQVHVGGGFTLSPRRAPFGRVHTVWKQVLPWGAHATDSAPRTSTARSALSQAQSSRWVLRLEGGAVLAADSTPVPSSQLFLAGGDNSVRGYGLRSIGSSNHNGTATAGRWLAVGSLEWQQPWAAGPNGERSPWESAVFLDGGSVADRLSDLRPRWGVGAGLRYLTPAGPVQVDLAYGVDRKRWRLHFAVGFAF
ncbi:MAG: hypothetical protein RLZZ612_1479 [Pseudomonadota bacterium]